MVAMGAIIYIYRSADGQKILRWALTLILGGAIGNLIDRLPAGRWHQKEALRNLLKRVAT